MGARRLTPSCVLRSTRRAAAVDPGWRPASRRSDAAPRLARRAAGRLPEAGRPAVATDHRFWPCWTSSPASSASSSCERTRLRARITALGAHRRAEASYARRAAAAMSCLWTASCRSCARVAGARRRCWSCCWPPCWLLRRHGGMAAAACRPPRGCASSPRWPLDARVRLVLVRRDGVEHLLAVGPGGVTVVEMSARRTASRSARRRTCVT